MGALMGFQAAQLTEIFRANVTRIRLFVGMDAIMGFQIALLRERFETDCALIRRRFVVRVPFHMNHQPIIVDECAIAYSAFVLLGNRYDICCGRMVR